VGKRALKYINTSFSQARFETLHWILESTSMRICKLIKAQDKLIKKRNVWKVFRVLIISSDLIVHFLMSCHNNMSSTHILHALLKRSLRELIQSLCYCSCLSVISAVYHLLCLFFSSLAAPPILFRLKFVCCVIPISNRQ